MDSKIILAIVAVAIVAVAAVAVIGLGGGSNEPASDEVRYEGNGGVTDKGSTHMESKITEVLGQIFNKDGYHIKNWNTKANGSGTAYEIGGKVSLGTTLYAQWSDANRLGAVNMYTSDFYLFIGQKGSSNLVPIDNGSAELPASDAIVVIMPAVSGSKVSLAEDLTVTITSGTKTCDIKLGIPVQGMSLSYGGLLSGDSAAYLNIDQSGKNAKATLSESVSRHRSQ